MKWTEERESILCECASLGVDEVRHELLLRTGATTSIDAITRHASRMGISLMRYFSCPVCGGRYTHLMSDGLCLVCHHRQLRDAYSAKPVDVYDRSEYIDAKRAYDLARKRKSQAVVSMDLSNEMSTARSGTKKT